MKSIVIAALIAAFPASAIAFPIGSDTRNTNTNKTESTAVSGANSTSGANASNRNENNAVGIGVGGSTESTNINRNYSPSNAIAGSESTNVINNTSPSRATSESTNTSMSGVVVQGDSYRYNERDRRTYTNIPAAPVNPNGYNFNASGAYTGQSLSIACPTGGQSFSLGIWLGGVSGSNASTKLPKECKAAMESMQEVLRRDAAMQAADALGGHAQQVLYQEVIYKYMEDLGLSRDRAESILKIQSSAMQPADLSEALEDSDRFINRLKQQQGIDYYRP